EVLGADVAVAELAGFVYRELDDLLCPRGEGDLAGRGRGVASADDELDGRAHLGKLDAQRGQNARRDAFALAHQPEKKVFRSYVVVVATARPIRREREDARGAG